MQFLRTSAVERVLSIPELLDIVFGMSDRGSNANNAQVCKWWSDRALDALWREVDDLHRLFSFLAPLENTIMTENIFREIPDADSWKRFERYSFRVRRLEYVHFNPSMRRKSLSRSVFDIVARTRLRLDILPNMHTLVWRGPVDWAVTIMHPGVKNFEVWLDGPDSPFLRGVALRMPHISNLNIKSIWPVRQYEADLIYLITQLLRLHTITFPRYYVTTKVMETLSQLPNLGVIEFQYEDQGCGDKEDVMPFTPHIDEGAFPTLSELSLLTTFDEIWQFLDHKFSPKRLTNLYVDSGAIETGESVCKFLCVVAENCPLLQVLYLTSFCFDVKPSEITPFKITIDQLKPLFKLSNLTSLEIMHYHPLALKMEDIDLFATSWQSLETLVLNNEPVRLEQSELTLEALLPFANHCPNLVHLGLFVDASCSKIPPPQLIPPLTSFKRLKVLSMGVSIIDDDQSAALYLSHILPLGCQVEQGVTWDENDSDVYEVVFDRGNWWGKVGKLLPVLTQLRVEEKERVKEMENEIDDLRMRNDFLSGSMSNPNNIVLDKSCVIA